MMKLPTATPTSFSTPRDTTATGARAPLASDPDGDPLTFTTAVAPNHGTVTIGAGGAYSYTPAPGYSGPDSFDYSACDPSAVCATATVTVDVSAAVP